MKKIEIELLPCPFCGEDEELSIEKSGSFYRVVCGWCAAMGPEGSKMQDAATAWSDRKNKEDRDKED